eukprot:CAMPEP_0206164732 /NCGR_PEP_ID=MMETSP1474-20131121/17861_1 /ASSEMBLY_ACC=CAM_ASM_001110 /TAXON_ID=97495 /ORGANISM="Imantonia sp., Strain RCC918" /LENGTH=94 /DNA_ID=CAMNT_0053567765 /DNA_START=3 /DNA_END=283 /DNA_ORIENTATION=+
MVDDSVRRRSARSDHSELSDSELAELLQRKQAEAKSTSDVDAMEGATSPKERPRLYFDPEAVAAAMHGSNRSLCCIGLAACLLLALVVAALLGA